MGEEIIKMTVPNLKGFGRSYQYGSTDFAEEETNEDEFIYVPCKICGEGKESMWEKGKDEIRKFLICADNIHAICCRCSYRITVPKGAREE